MTMRLSLHTWTLDTTPLADALAVIKETGWDAVELRRLDFERAAQAGQSADQVLALVRASGLPVACVGVELGWIWATGEERARLLRVFAEQCCAREDARLPTVMSPVDRGRARSARAAASIREVGDIARAHGVRLAVEFNSQAEQLNALGPMREVVTRAGHPSVGFCSIPIISAAPEPRRATSRTCGPRRSPTCSTATCRAPASSPGKALDRLPPGQGYGAVQGVLRGLRGQGVPRVPELRGAQSRRVEAPGRGGRARGARRDARGPAVAPGSPGRYRAPRR